MSFPNNSINKRYVNILFYVFIVIYFSFLIYLAYIINIWEDEAYTLNTTSNNLAKVISQSYGFEGQPPVYFILLAIWRLISPGIFMARLFSIVFIGLSAYIFNRIVRFVSDLKSANWILVIFLLNPFTVWAAVEIRTYALLIFLSTVSVYTILVYYTKNQKIYLYYFLLTCLIGLYTQYYFVFLIAAIAISLFVYKGWRTFFRFSLYFIPVAILFLPNFYFLSQNIKNFQSVDPGYSITQRLWIVLTSIQNITLGLNILNKLTWIKWSVRIVFIFLIIISYLEFYKAYKTTKKLNVLKYNILLVATFLLFMFFIAFIFITGMKFNERYLAITFPFIILLFFIFNRQSVTARNLIYGGISVYFITLLLFNYSVPIKTYDYDSIAKYVEDIEKPNEAVLMNSETISTPFEYYYTGSNHLVQLPDTFKLAEHGFQVLITDTLELKLIIENINTKSILFINDSMIGYGPKLSLDPGTLDKYLNSHFRITLDTLIFGKSKTKFLRIRRLEKPLPPSNSIISIDTN